ncbi:unnamed protein product [Euphydryas editha]|uniref:Reverse transcriptase domain-containing protein n=1 Tax=Euphydryas editha TaxID=104508 RepID=A0AAU9V387_EUPED|nr:unnamed protein product [Euphydryas editha]
MSKKCDICDRSITKSTPGLECSKCERIVHLNTKCAGLTNKQIAALKAATSLEWTCRECQNELPRRNSTIIVPEDKEEEDDDTPVQINAKKLLENISKEVQKAIKLEMREVHESLQFHTAKLDEVVECMEVFRKNIKDLERKNQTLTNKNINLENRIGAMEQRIQELEQEKLNKYLEIANVPTKTVEEMKQVINNIAAKLKQPKEEIKSRRIQGQKDLSSKILVEFKDEDFQEKWINTGRNVNITVADINPNEQNNNNPVYIRESMTKYNKQLFWNTKQELKITKKFKITTQSNYSANLCAIYRPPNSSKRLFIDELKTVIEQLNKHSDLFLLGDVNIDLKLDNPIAHCYNNTLHGLGLMCGIKEYTRIELSKRSLSKTCIDHIYARSSSQDLFTSAIGTTLADHRTVLIACVGSPTQDITKYKIRFNYSKLNKLLDEVKWERTHDMSCPIMINNFICNNFRECYAKSRSQFKIRNTSRKNNHWVTDKVIKVSQYRDELFLKYIKDPNNKILKRDYNKSRNYANRIIRNAKNQHLKNEIILNKRDPRKLWQILNRITGKIKKSIDDTLLSAFKKNGNTNKNIANNFANSFVNSVQDIMPKCSIPLLNKSSYAMPVNVSMRLKPADSKSVETIIKNLNINKAPGKDGIRAIDLKRLCKNITSTIANLINQSIINQKHPASLKIGIVRPIYKKGNQNEYENYRPITILPVIDKIVEKYICKEINNFYNKNNIINKQQFGFQPHRNTTQLLTKFTDSIFKHLDEKKHVMVVFIDYTKAFDTLRHKILLNKLDDNGIRGNLLGWCKNYLEERSFIVKVGDVESDETRVTEGTAQGSVLGPLHYITYVNDLSNIIQHCEIYQFADDTCLVSKGSNAEEALSWLQKDFNLLLRWSHDAGLVLNANKTKLMYISTSQNRSEILPCLISHNHECLHKFNNSSFQNVKCHCKSIDVVSKQTYLGLVIDNRLNWKDHINHICDKLRAILAKFSVMKWSIPYSIRLQLYKSLAESIISYGLSSYGRTYKTHLNKIYTLQLRLLKEIVPINIKNKFRNDYHQLFEHCKIMPIHDKIKLTLLSEEYFNDKLKILNKVDPNSIITRQKSNAILLLPKYNNLYGKRKLHNTIHLVT